MKKFSNETAQKYWRENYKKKSKAGDIGFVCFPDKSRFFNSFFDSIQRFTLNRFYKDTTRGGVILDLGCGTGRWLSFFKQRGFDVAGVDLSSDAIDICKHKGFENVFVGDICNLTMFQAESFDYINSITVLLHIPFDKKSSVIHEIARLLKKDGVVTLIESTWNDPCPWVYGMDIAEWDKMMEKAGLFPVEKSAHYFCFFRTHFPGVNNASFIETFAVLLDYVCEFLLMFFTHKKTHNKAMQHFMVYKKMETT